ncbi:unnamed protein product [Lactuca saligna]|uniref:Pentacotripeptide-repeat region of PRORP domain-containing protein n=1 Tax=Lactuca saligna TaxID=75948 RepID=A0AA36E8V0_LACSI|nr:unnamed protein product [Lactuca saligna]
MFTTNHVRFQLSAEMNLLKPYRKTLQFSTLTSLPPPPTAPDVHLVGKAITILKRHHLINLDPLSSQFTPQSASYLLLQAQSDKTLILSFINWARRRPFFDLQCSCLSLHILTRFKLYKTAQIIAEDVAINSPGDENGELVFTCLKDTYSDCTSSSAVIDLLVYCRITLFSMRLFGLASRLKDLEKGLEFFAEMQKNGCLPNVVTYNTLIDAYCKSRKLDDAFKLFKTMTNKDLEPNLISYNVILNGLAREWRMNETDEVLEEMKHKRIIPDEVTYNTLVNGYCKEACVKLEIYTGLWNY